MVFLSGSIYIYILFVLFIFGSLINGLGKSIRVEFCFCKDTYRCPVHIGHMSSVQMSRSESPVPGVVIAYIDHYSRRPNNGVE